jgi:hypothetical protein
MFVISMNHYTADDFPWGEYKDWSTYGKWYSPRYRNLKSLTAHAMLCYVILYYKLFMFLSLDMEIWKPWSSQVHPEAQPKGVHATEGC